MLTILEQPYATVAPSFVVIDTDTAGNSEAVCVALSRTTAERLVVLVDRHGLFDIPDSVAGIPAPWPAPTGAPATPPAPVALQ